MNLHRPKIFVSTVRWLCALLLLTVGSNCLRAETNPPERWLLVFDASSTMKKYLPATGAAVQQFLATSASGQLHQDDSVGIWSFSRQISDQFRSYNWEPKDSEKITASVFSYMKQLRYTNSSTLSALQSPLSHIVASSERLTVVIFCDGQSPINFTPYDDGINQSFHDGLDERKKSRQPFVVVVRSQLGKFIGCTVSYPPANVNLPDFPPLPPPPPHTNAPPPHVEAKEVVPPLIIVGTKVGTNLNSLTETALPKPKPVVITTTNAPKPAVVQPKTNPSVLVKTAEVEKSPPPLTTNGASASKPTQTNATVAPVHSTIMTQATATVKAPPASTDATSKAAVEKRDRLTGVLIVIGVCLLLLAVALVGFLIRSSRRPRSSLITSSMQDQPPRK